MNPFEQLVSPQALAEAIAASAELQQLPSHFYRPLDGEQGRWKKPVDAGAAAVAVPASVPRQVAMPERRTVWAPAPPRLALGLQR